jgi:hypothetical protein
LYLTALLCSREDSFVSWSLLHITSKSSIIWIKKPFVLYICSQGLPLNFGPPPWVFNGLELTTLKLRDALGIKPSHLYLWRKVVCFVVMRSTEPGCFRSCSWCLWKALDKEGCMGLVPWRLDLQCKSSWILNDFFTEN